MPFGQLVIGSPGSGKTTYCDGLHQFLTAIGRSVFIVNLDPANGRKLPYSCAINIADLITVKDVQMELGLGPNGAMLYCIEYLEENYDWLDKKLDALGDDAYVAFDLPGQVELSTNHASLRRILERLQKKDWRLVAVHLLDASHIIDAARYVSLLLLSLRAMLTLELPHVNVLSKVDLLGEAANGVLRRGGSRDDDERDEMDMENGSDGDASGDDTSIRSAPRGGLAFNLDYYTEVQDLSYLVDHLNEAMGPRRSKQFAQLNEKICELIEDFGLVQFETLAVEDKRSMLRLQRVLDKATGYVFVEDSTVQQQEGDRSQNPIELTNGSGSSQALHERVNSHRRGTAASAAALFSVADQGAPLGWGTATDVQERWVDHRDEWAPFEAKERLDLETRWEQERKAHSKEDEAMEKEKDKLGPIRER